MLAKTRFLPVGNLQFYKMEIFISPVSSGPGIKSSGFKVVSRPLTVNVIEVNGGIEAVVTTPKGMPPLSGSIVPKLIFPRTAAAMSDPANESASRAMPLTVTEAMGARAGETAAHSWGGP